MRGMVAAAGVLLMVLAGCENGTGSGGPAPRSPQPTPQRESSRLLGLVGSMSGSDSWRGESAFEGADVAVHVLNTQGDPQNDYELVVRDDMGDPDTAGRYVEQLAADDRVVGIVYAGPPEALPEAEDELARAGSAAVLIYGDLYGRRRLSPHVFQASPSLVWEARRIGSYLASDRRYRRVGLVSTSRSPADRELRSSLRRSGGARLVVVRTSAGARSTLAHLRRKRVQAVVVAGPPAAFAAVLERLRSMGSAYRTTRRARRSIRPRRPWRPQVSGYDLAISSRISPPPPPGTIASDTLLRGAHFLPVPSLAAFRRAFVDWWDKEPLDWQGRAYDAVRALGWADRLAGEHGDVARALERLRSRRFGGLDITLGPDDHTFVDQAAVGLWTVPRPRLQVQGAGARPSSLPWVPLARGFSIDGENTDIASRDWRYLFRKAPPPGAAPPRVSRMRFAVVTRRRDPVH